MRNKPTTLTNGPELVRFIKFVFSGGLSVLVNMGSRIVINEYMSYRWSVAFAYLCGMATAFVLFRLLVFPYSGRSTYSELFGFVLVNVFGAAQVWIVSVGLAEYYFPWIGFKWNPELVAHFAGLSSVVVTSYLGHKHLSFRPRESQASP